ncbi:hypothetical protein [Micromonospora arida]|uniref:hypothetical protein n=1 Tax=Micromonospora arida TaxID=2203715 RepID=UPI0033A84D6B
MESMARQRTAAEDDDQPIDPPGDSSVLPELEDRDWLHHAQEFAHTSFWAVARRLPRLVREAVGLAWSTNQRDTVASIGLNIAAGVMTTFGLLATTSVLRELFAAGPTPDRVRSALPALIVAAAAVSARGGLTIAAGWAQARLTPRSTTRWSYACSRPPRRWTWPRSTTPASSRRWTAPATGGWARRRGSSTTPSTSSPAWSGCLPPPSR